MEKRLVGKSVGKASEVSEEMTGEESGQNPDLLPFFIHAVLQGEC